MKILAIDSSSTPASIAVTDGEMPIGEFTININRTHSEKLLPLVDSLLDAINLKASDIDETRRLLKALLPELTD